MLSLSKQEQARQVLLHSNGIARTADFLLAGLSKVDVCTLHAQGYLTRIRHGYYQLAGDVPVSEEQLLATLIPEGIICAESALFYYGYSDFTPRVWTISVPRTISRAKLKAAAIDIKPYYMSQKYREIGKTTTNCNGIELAIYDKERTICDCFRYRAKMDNEMFNKAIHLYANDEKKNLRNLLQYAKQFSIFQKVTELMEVMLNG